MPCDAACIKHILNGGFMATLAPVLDRTLLSYGLNPAAHDAATGLAATAKIHRDMLATLGYTVTPEQAKGFSGCEQAQLLVKWIHDPSQADAGKMNEWTAELWAQIADLADGKLP